MAQQQQDDDYADLIQDPGNVQAGITDAYTAAQTNARNSFQLGNAVAAQGGNLIGQGFSQMLGNPDIGDPKVVQARHIQGAMTQILQEANNDAPEDESPMDKQQRVATMVAARMSGISPQIALKANMQAVAIQEAKNQQGLITANTRRINDVSEEDEATTAVKKAGANYQVYGMIKDKYGMPSLQTVGDMIPLYGSDGKLRTADFSTDVSKALAAARAQGISSPVMDTVSNVANNKQQLASTRADAIIQRQQASAAAKQNGLDDQSNKYMLAGFLLDPKTVPMAQRPGMYGLMAKYQISPADGIAAKAEVAAMKSSAAAIGTREGNIAILQKSIDGLGQNTLSALDNVNRGRISGVNSVIAAGKAQFGDGPEKSYAIAVNGMVQEYARLMAGGTGITSDAAADHARALISKADSPEAMKAAVKQLNTETNTITHASAEALEVLANPGKYPRMLKIQKALGITELPEMVNDDTGAPIPGTGFSPATAAGTTLTKSGPRGSGAGTLVSGSPGNGNLTYNPSTGKFN